MPKPMRFAFIDRMKKAFPIELLCRVLKVTSRGLRAWRSRPISQRQRDDMILLAHIREQHRRSLHSYGRPRITEELKDLWFAVGHRRIGRVPRINDPPDHLWNPRHCLRTAFRCSEPTNTRPQRRVRTILGPVDNHQPAPARDRFCR